MNTSLYIRSIIVVLACTAQTSAQNSAVSWQAFGGGFTKSSAPDVRITTGLGYSFAGGSQFGNTRVTSGFLSNPLLRTSGATTIALGVTLAVGWNLASLPVSAPIPNDSVSHLYTNLVFPHAFAFNNGYVQQSIMSNGPGYWIKSSQGYTQNITGTIRDTLTIPVVMGWNIVGSISTSIDTSAAYVTPSVPGLRAANFFRYNNGYQIAENIEPGAGYWVKASGTGSFFMHQQTPVGATAGKGRGEAHTAERTVDDLNTLTIRDAAGGVQTLYFGADDNSAISMQMYALPPLPPTGSFDARFSTAEGGTMAQTHPADVDEAIEIPIAIQPSAYPLTVEWKIHSGSYELKTASGTVLSLRGEGRLELNRAEVHIADDINRLSLLVTGGGASLPTEFALHQNYPNPFNPVTHIKFALPRASHVTLTVYDVLGQRVKVLADAVRSPGVFDVEWDGTNINGFPVNSGVYFCTLNVYPHDGTHPFSSVKKMLFLK